MKKMSISEVGRGRIMFCVSVTLLVFFVIMRYPGQASAELTVTANHDRIKIDFLYHGSSVSVRGEADAGTDLIVKIASPEGHEALKKKGKMAGLLWMNVGELTFEHVPTLYFVHSTKNLEDILSRAEMDKYVIGYPALERHSELKPALTEGEKDSWFREFLKYKQASRLYDMSVGKLYTSDTKKDAPDLVPGKEGKQNYYTLLDWPYQAPPGDYIVTVYAVKDNKVIEKAETAVVVEQVGLVKTLSSMAKNRGGLYGILSILAALGTGFGVGMVFRKGGGAH